MSQKPSETPLDPALLRMLDRYLDGDSIEQAARLEGVELATALGAVERIKARVSKHKRSDPPPAGAPWIPHVVVDVAAIAGAVVLAALGAVPGAAALTTLTVVHGLYAAQAARSFNSKAPPRSPLLAFVAAGTAAAAVARDVLHRWYS